MRPGTRWKRRTRTERANRGPRPIQPLRAFLHDVGHRLDLDFIREKPLKTRARLQGWDGEVLRWHLPTGDFGIIQTKPQPTHWLDRT